MGKIGPQVPPTKACSPGWARMRQLPVYSACPVPTQPRPRASPWAGQAEQPGQRVAQGRHHQAACWRAARPVCRGGGQVASERHGGQRALHMRRCSMRIHAMAKPAQ